MRLLLILCSLISSMLFSYESSTPQELAALQGEPSALVCDCVNAITGDFIYSQEDATVKGAEPLPLLRRYISRETENVDLRWKPFYHLTAVTRVIGPIVRIFVPEKNGIYFDYFPPKGSFKRTGLVFDLPAQLTCRPLPHSFEKGIVNQIGYNPQENQVEFSWNELKVISSNGGYRLYRCISYKDLDVGIESADYYYSLDHEQLPNGNKIFYVYEDRSGQPVLKEVYTTNSSGTKQYAKALFHLFEKGFHIQTSDAKELNYHFSKKKSKNQKGFLLKSALTPNYPKETLKRNKNLLITQRIFPDGRKVQLEYDNKNRVVKIICPYDIHYKLKYHDDESYTEVTGPDQCKTLYHYDPTTLRLKKIRTQDPDQSTLKTEIFHWTSDGYLKSKQILDQNQVPCFRIIYQYDAKRNLIKKTVIGKISPSENSDEKYSIHYAYDTLNRLIEEKEDNGLITTFSYLEKTLLPTSKITSRHNTLLKRHLYAYNEDHILISEVTDDGDCFTERHIKKITPKNSDPFNGLPEMIEEFYEQDGEEKLLKKTRLAYDEWGNVREKTIYDANDEKRYSLLTQYNANGQIILEKDALGNATRYDYDENGNKIKEISPLNCTTTYSYDQCNRILSKTETTDTDKFVTLYKDYGSHNQPQRIINYLGAETHQSYDPFGNLLSTSTEGAKTTFSYNALNQKISTTDPRGNKTKTTYNIHGNPLKISHPDHTNEQYTYNLDGTKASATNQNRVTTKYFYDNFGNIAQEEIYDRNENLIGKITRLHNAFHLLEETNLEGYKTTYQYNQAGQLIQKTTEDHLSTYTYDALGRCAHETGADYTLEKDYDLLDRVISEREYSINTLLTEKHTEYNALSSPTKIITYPSNVPAEKTFEYDSFGREIKQIDPLGHEKTTHYLVENKQLKILTTEPGNIRILKTYNNIERLLSIERRNSCGEPIGFVKFEYDLNGNKTLEETSLYQVTQKISIHHLTSTYDPLNRLKTQTESGKKTTQYTYTKTGLLQTVTKPDQTILRYAYNSLGHLTSLASSDNTIHYTYLYNKLGHLIESTDRLSKTSTTRILDPHGNILQETLASGYTFKNLYDTLNRRTALTLPNIKTISYNYLGPYLKAVEFDTLNQTYTYDKAGSILQTEHIDRSLTTYEYDLLSQPQTLRSPHFHQACTYDPRGNIASMHYDAIPQNFHYDDHDHLISEPLHDYTYDSLHNRITKDQASYKVNDLNQVENTSLTNYEYDLNGNLIRWGDTHFKYDALDRLIQVFTPTETVQYSYDSEHRRISKNNIPYLWDGQHELGTLDCYRILGPTDNAEIGSAIAVILNNQAHLPIHDLQGNLIKLFDLSDKLIENHTFTTFGECDSPLKNIPWGFSSKSEDPETHFIYFGRRYYDPALGRFITPDPEGYTDSINLYSYCSNNPLIHSDPYGLLTTQYQSWFNSMEGKYWESDEFLKSDLRQSAIGIVNAPFQWGVDTVLSMSKYAGGIHGTEDMSLLESYNIASQTNQYFQKSTEKWSQNFFGADSNNPFYSFTYRGSYMATDLVSGAFMPFGNIKKVEQVYKTVNSSSKIINTIPKIFQKYNITKLHYPLEKKSINGIVKSIRENYIPSNFTPKKFFSSKTYAEIEELLMKKFGSPKGIGLNNKSFYNPNTGRTFNLHWDPLHRQGKPHIDIRKRGLSSDYYKNRPFFLKENP